MGEYRGKGAKVQRHKEAKKISHKGPKTRRFLDADFAVDSTIAHHPERSRGNLRCFWSVPSLAQNQTYTILDAIKIKNCFDFYSNKIL